jgi:hypothetical protein
LTKYLSSRSGSVTFFRIISFYQRTLFLTSFVRYYNQKPATTMALPGSPLLKPPTDSGSGSGTPEDVVSNPKQYAVSALCSADSTLRNAAYTLAPDYSKISWAPGLFNISVSVSKDMRFYFAWGGNHALANESAFSGDTHHLLNGLKLRAIPQFQVGYFVNGVNNEEQRHEAITEPRASLSVPFLPFSAGVDKSLPSDGHPFWQTPTAVEVGTPGGGFDTTFNSEVLPSFSEWLKRHTAPPNVCQPQQ